MLLGVTVRNVAEFEALPSRHAFAAPVAPDVNPSTSSLVSALFIALQPYPDAIKSVVRSFKERLGMEIDP